MNALVIIGAGGHGKVVADTAESCGYSNISFVDRNWPDRLKNGRWPVVGSNASLDNGMQFCAIGNNATRAKVFTDQNLDNSPILIHQSAVISPTVKLGAGTVVVAGAVVNADTHVGRGVILNTGCSVDHDCSLGDFVHISPGARLAGNVTVGDCSWVGIGAVVIEGVSIGRNVIIAAGAAVINDVKDGEIVGGVPAKNL